MADQPHWDLVDLEGGRSWEVWRSGHANGVPSRHLFGTIAVGEFGYAVRDRAGAEYGPFATLDEAAYGLAAREDLGDPLLLGEPVAGPPVPDDLTSGTRAGGDAPTGRRPARSGLAAVLPGVDSSRLPRDQRGLLLALAAAGGALVALVLVAVLIRVVRRP